MNPAFRSRGNASGVYYLLVERCLCVLCSAFPNPAKRGIRKAGHPAVFERDEIPPWRVASNKIFLRDTKLFFASRKCYRLPALFKMVKRFGNTIYGLTF